MGSGTSPSSMIQDRIAPSVTGTRCRPRSNMVSDVADTSIRHPGSDPAEIGTMSSTTRSVSVRCVDGGWTEVPPASDHGLGVGCTSVHRPSTHPTELTGWRRTSPRPWSGCVDGRRPKVPPVSDPRSGVVGTSVHPPATHRTEIGAWSHAPGRSQRDRTLRARSMRVPRQIRDWSVDASTHPW